MNFEGTLPGLPAFIEGAALNEFYPTNYDSAVFIHNPGATRKGETDDAIRAMAKACDNFGIELSIAETSPEIDENVDILRENVGKDSLVIVRSGDGGLSKMLAAMRQAKLENPVLAESGGHKNDIVRQLFGRAYREHPESILNYAVVRKLYPIELSITDDSRNEEEFDAYGYASIGVSSVVADKASSSDWRKEQSTKSSLHVSFSEDIMAARGIMQAVPYILGITTEEHAEDVEPKAVIDFILGNGSSMAGTMDLGHNLFTPGFRRITSRNKLGGWVTALMMMAHIPVGTKVSAENALTLKISEGSNQMQIDGEIVQLTGAATIQARSATTGVNMLVSPFKK